MIKKISKDKRILFIYLFVIVGLSIGFTYAASSSSLGMNIATALISVDEDVYGQTSINTAAIDFKPIIESEVETNTENVIKIEFLVGGASTNNASNVIYDIALVDLNIDCELISPYIKWKLVKDGTLLSTGGLDKGIKNNRLVLTENQLDLPSYSDTQSGYHSYIFYMWFNDSCQAGDIKNCLGTEDQSDLLGKYFSGKIEVELYTGSKIGYGPISERAASETASCRNYAGKFQLLSDVAPGSYVKYTGNNGCDGKSCEGQNANYVNEDNTGWCIMDVGYSDNPSNGWRLAYIDDGIPYLISAGATDCIATDANGNISSSQPHTGIQSASDMYKHINNLNNTALKYCNKNFAYGGKCNLSTAWAMNNVDFEQITGSELSSTSCLAYTTGDGTYECGTGNDLIDNGIQYWFAFDVNEAYLYFWHNESGYHNVSDDPGYGSSTGWANGVRPVLKLADTIVVTGGTGTEDDPYTIANKENLLLSDIAKPGDYVKYTGTNGCEGEFCNGRNANFNDADRNNGYCHDSNVQFYYDGWRVGYIEDGSTHLISAGAPECLSTDENGVPSNTDSSTHLTSQYYKHLDNANAIALKYCNSRFAYGGKCDLNSVWAFASHDGDGGADFGFTYAGGTCIQNSYEECGVGNVLTDIGGYYWIDFGESGGTYLYWEPGMPYMDYNFLSDYALGVRPVIKLDDEVIVVGGSGTYEDPYIIGN